jgi:uncharacterized repeat protein (TIGR01451 family)
VAAYDPNDKQVDAEIISPEDVEDRIKLKYTIRFQNTGDAPAVNVIIRDTLDDNVDISTFEMIGATHNYQLSLNGRELVWTFPNIMLPDSTTDFDASIGAFHYRIAVNDDLLLGDQVANTAHIYFDYADPIVTNTVLTTVSTPTGIGNAEAHRNTMLVHPSPTTGPFNIRWLGEATSNMHIEFTDAIGRTVLQRSIPALQHAQDLPFDLSSLPAGSYFVRMHGAQADVRSRLVIQR